MYGTSKKGNGEFMGRAAGVLIRMAEERKKTMRYISKSSRR
jgi:hypothetical protein